MAAMTIEQLYEQHIKPLPTTERLRLVEKIVGDLATQSPEGELPKRRQWREICGAAPYPLLGEDAQAWVSRTRREGDDHLLVDQILDRSRALSLNHLTGHCLSPSSANESLSDERMAEL